MTVADHDEREQNADYPDLSDQQDQRKQANQRPIYMDLYGGIMKTPLKKGLKS